MLKRLSREIPPLVVTLDDLATLADYSLMDTLNCDPEGKANGAEQSKDVEEKYYRLKPPELFEVGGSSHYSCSS